MSKVLIIDDDKDMVETMQLMLEKDYEVSGVLSGDEGLKRAKAEKPDLIILDVMMETASKGFEVSRAIRQDPVIAKTPILMLTAIAEKTGLDFSKEAGDETWLPVDAYLPKPVQPEALLIKVRELLGR